LEEFWVKKYASHRGINATDLAEAKKAKKAQDARYFQKGKALAPW